MKKFMLATFALAVFVSQANAAYAACDGDLAGYQCLYSTGACWDINKGENDNGDCATAITNCETTGWLFRNVPETGKGATGLCTGGTFQTGRGKDDSPITSVPTGDFGCCAWDGGSCWKMVDQGEYDDCTGSSAHTYYSSCDNTGTCPASGGQSGSDNGGGGNNNPSGGNDTGTPILISVPKVAGLTVVSNGNILHILSAQDATISLFDIRGTKVLSGKASAGKNSAISLESQKQGIYYAVVQSGSHKQTLKVVLK